MAAYTELRARYLIAMGLPAVLLACPNEDRPADSAKVVIPPDVGDSSLAFNATTAAQPAADASITRSDPADASLPVATDPADATLPVAVTVKPPAVKATWTAAIPGQTAPASYCAAAIKRAECRVFADPYKRLCAPGAACTAANKTADSLACPPALTMPLPCSPISVAGCNGGTFSGTLMVDITTRERTAHPAGCCYDAPQPPCGTPFMGRALIDEGRVVLGDIRGEAPCRRAKELARMAAMEWASVASFSRASLELMALGAPPDLLAEAHRAALDEIEHTRLMLAAASRASGNTFAPGPVPALAPRSLTFATLASTTFTEACVGETLGAMKARIDAETEADPELRDALLVIASDEERHAELAWKTLAWAVRSGGEEARAALREALAATMPTELGDVYDAVVVPCAEAILVHAIRSVDGASSGTSASAAANARASG